MAFAAVVGDIPVFVTDQAVVGHHIRVEIHLYFGIEGDDLQRGGQVFNEELLGFVQARTGFMNPVLAQSST